MQYYSKNDCLDCVLKSPLAVTSKDQRAWLDIFARYCLVEDPVGSAPHLSGVYDRALGRRGNAPLMRFYNTFIAPYEIIFHVDRDVVEGLLVVRDLTIEIRMSARVRVHVPMHLMYELVEEQGELKIFRLAAHWEMLPSLRQQMSFGWDSVSAGLAAGWRMYRHLGLSGSAGFMRAIRSIGYVGKLQLDTFVRFVNGGNADGVSGLMNDSSGSIYYAGEKLSPAQLVKAQLSVSTGKIIAAGNYVSASCRVSSQESIAHGVVLFEFSMKTRKICEVRFYLEEAP